MSYRAEQEAIEEHFTTNWSATFIVYDNGAPPENETEWVRLTIHNDDALQASMGDDPSFRFWGMFFVQIFTAKDIGAGRAMELADLVDGLYRNAVVSNIHFKVPQVRKVPLVDSEWYQVNVSTEFYRGS
jgi:Bacteriophage related domain of unknown function